MSAERWDAVDDYVTDLLVGEDPALEQALEASAASGLPPIAVTAPQGKLLALLVRIQGASRVLEIGTLGAYSTIWIARALPPGGLVVSLELVERYAEVARANLERAGVGERVQLRVGPAADSLRALIDEGAGPFDMVFIDADKQSTADYFTLALELSRPGSVIVTDNVVLDGGLADASNEDPRVLGMRRFHELVAATAGRQRDDDPDRRREGLRRVHAGARGGLGVGRGEDVRGGAVRERHDRDHRVDAGGGGEGRAVADPHAGGVVQLTATVGHRVGGV